MMLAVYSRSSSRRNPATAAQREACSPSCSRTIRRTVWSSGGIVRRLARHGSPSRRVWSLRQPRGGSVSLFHRTHLAVRDIVVALVESGTSPRSQSPGGVFKQTEDLATTKSLLEQAGLLPPGAVRPSGMPGTHRRPPTRAPGCSPPGLRPAREWRCGEATR